MLDAIAQHYGRPAAGIVIPNGRAANAFSRGSVKEPFVLSVGRLWDEAKNAAALAAIATQLDWPVRLAGDVNGPDGDARVLPGVEILGRCTPAGLAGVYARAAIYALPARYEPFGLSVLEAAFAGCALILGDIPSLRENWDGAAVFVPPENHGALRDAITDLIATPARRHRLAAAARLRAARFSADRMVARYVDAYRGLCGSEAAAPASRRLSSGQPAGNPRHLQPAPTLSA
jgi:glycosyltransferase involved in cell wall biosynthesis